jgi:drug/metabolite transporter (DMT)-like permease
LSPTTDAGSGRDARWRWTAALSFAAVYVIWGSTYAAIRVGVAELPPALFAGARFVAAGLILAIYARLVAGQQLPVQRREWRIVIVSGLFMLGAANGLVVWGEQWLPSGQAALLVATAALWIAGFGALGPEGNRPGPRTLAGLAVGFGGAVILLWPPQGFVFENFGAQLAILVASLSWSAGSMYVKRQKPGTPPLMSAAMQSLTAGVVLSGIGFGLGESARWVWTPNAMWTLAYLIVFGSCIAYAAYVWLLHHVSPSALGTYAYVNPVAAVIVGWLFLDETLTATELAGMVVILAGIVLVSTGRNEAAVERAT